MFTAECVSRALGGVPDRVTLSYAQPSGLRSSTIAAMFPQVTVRRIISLTVIAACAIWYFKQNVLNVLPTPGLSDFRFYYIAAQHVLRGESPYLAVGYMYPPFLACALAPLGWFDYYTARWIWFVFEQACFLSAAYLLWRRIGRDWVASIVIAIVWATGWAAQDGFPTGQPDALLTLLIVVACAGAGWVSGVAAGAGFAVKLIPAALGLLGPLERNWRELTAFFASAIAMLVVPWAIIGHLYGPKKPLVTDYIYGTPCVLSWSIPSVALRIMEPPGPDGRLPNNWVNGWDLPNLYLSAQQKILSMSAAVITFAIGFGVLLFKTRGRIADHEVPVVGTALVALTLAASPIAWWHYQAMQYPGIALLFCLAIRRRHWWTLVFAFVCALFLFPLPAGVLRYYYHQAEQWPNAPSLMYFWTSLTPVASLALFGLFLKYLSRQRERETAAEFTPSGEPTQDRFALRG